VSRRLEVRPQARSDIEAAHAWYEQQFLGLGEKFVRAVDEAFAALLRHPEMYARVHRDIRRVLVQRFPYGVYYLVRGDAVVVLACTHLRRHPRVWRSRR